MEMDKNVAGRNAGSYLAISRKGNSIKKKSLTLYIAAFVAFFFASFSAVAGTCSDLEASLTVTGKQLYAAQHVNVVYCLSIFPNGYVCGSDIQFHIESQVSNGSEQRRNGYRYVGPPSTGSVVSVWYTPWESCGSVCPIDPLPELPKGDLCTDSLEQGAGVDVNNACTSSLDDRWTNPNGGQMQCLANKISRLGLHVPYTGPGATIRTTAYQQHFVDIWKWNEDITDGQSSWSAAEKQACAQIVAKVDAEMAKHKIVSDPSKKGGKAPHVLGQAIDISEAVVDAVDERVSDTTFIPPTLCLFCMPTIPVYIGDVQDYVNSAMVNPPACNLIWGGRFKKYDGVHFQLP